MSEARKASLAFVENVRNVFTEAVLRVVERVLRGDNDSSPLPDSLGGIQGCLDGIHQNWNELSLDPERTAEDVEHLLDLINYAAFLAVLLKYHVNDTTD